MAEAVSYLAEQASQEVALRFVEELEGTFALLSSEPEVGSIYRPNNPELGGVRAWRVHRFERYLIFYRVLDEALEIERVLHGSRDIWSLLGLEE